MKEKLRNLFDEMKVRSRYKSMNAIIDMIEPLINQEVEKRIAERMPSEKERKEWLNSFDFGNVECYNYGRAGAIAGIEWLRSCLTCSEKPNNSQKTEGGEG